MSYSQSGQDEWVLSMFTKKGYFLDIGAFNGITFSNTYLLELLGWEGLCIEASPVNFEALTKFRANAVNIAVANYIGKLKMHEGGSGTKRKENGNIEVYCHTIGNIMQDHNVPKHINYISLDIEGMEADIIETFPFSEYEVDLLTIEHNLYFEGDEYKNRIFAVMDKNGFARMREDVSADSNPYEDWYANKKFIQ